MHLNRLRMLSGKRLFRIRSLCWTAESEALTFFLGASYAKASQSDPKTDRVVLCTGNESWAGDKSLP